MNTKEIYSLPHRKKRNPYPPRRNCAELAQEFGISANSLRGMLGKEGAPKPVLDNRNHCKGVGAKTYYDHAEVRRWYKNKIANVTEKSKT